MGSFLERKRFSINSDGSYKLDWLIPTLTIGAELDGLLKLHRIAEASYKQADYKNMPVVLVKGGNHM